MRATCARSVTAKERRVVPQIIVGLLVDRTGLAPPDRLLGGQSGRDHHDHLRRGGLPGRPRHRGTRGGRRAPACSRRPTSKSRTTPGCGSSPGARQVRAPGDLEAHFHWAGDAPADGQLTRLHHPQARLQHRAGQEPQGRAGMGPCHPPGIVETRCGPTPRSTSPGTTRP